MERTTWEASTDRGQRDSVGEISEEVSFELGLEDLDITSRERALGWEITRGECGLSEAEERKTVSRGGGGSGQPGEGLTCWTYTVL